MHDSQEKRQVSSHWPLGTTLAQQWKLFPMQNLDNSSFSTHRLLPAFWCFFPIKETTSTSNPSEIYSPPPVGGVVRSIIIVCLAGVVDIIDEVVEDVVDDARVEEMVDAVDDAVDVADVAEDVVDVEEIVADAGEDRINVVEDDVDLLHVEGIVDCDDDDATLVLENNDAL